MGIPIRAWRQIFDTEFCDGSRFGTIISNIDDYQFFRHFRVEQGKNKMRASKTSIHYHYIVGKREILHLFDYCRAKAVIGKQGVSTPCYNDLRIKHNRVTLTG